MVSSEKAGLKAVMEFFGMTAKEMMKEWKAMSDKDKVEIQSGLANGTLTY